MIFKQLFDPALSAMTYLIADPASREAIVIDPLKYQATMILALLAEHRLRLKYALRTHVHRPHLVECSELCARTGARFMIGARNAPDIAGDRLREGDVLGFGGETLTVIETPGHTPGCVTYLWRDRIFCGDLLELGGCGQTEDETDPGAMYDSVRQRIFSLPGETLIFPGHDYAGRTVSTVAEERVRNTLFAGLARDAFMDAVRRIERRPTISPQEFASASSLHARTHPAESARI